MNDFAILSGTTGQHPLTEDVPNGWRPTGILYRRITYQLSPDGLAIIYDPKWSSYVAFGVDVSDIEEFVARLLDDSYMPSRMLSYTPLDISIYADCYVVLHLEPHSNLQFATGEYGVTTDAPDPQVYFQLRYILDDPAGQSVSPTEQQDCRIAYFSAQLRGSDPLIPDHFNIFIQLGGQQSLPIIVDPDIQNPGHPQLVQPRRRARSRRVPR